jgi:hypothetical protein
LLVVLICLLREKLGWKPIRGEVAWERDFEDELKALREGRRGATIASCINEDSKTP